MTKRLLLLAAATVLAFAASASADWDPSQPYKWVQYPDLNPTGMDVNACEPYYLLADDFLCTKTGPITDIHIWGSWYHDVLPEGLPTAVGFTLSIHEDIPESLSQTGYSMPGDILWIEDFTPGEFGVQVWADSLTEGWLEPPDVYEPFGDSVCWQYNFFIDDSLAFIQQGTEEQPVVYWLDVQAHPLDTQAWFGWKTSRDHWNDDAVWGTGPEPYYGSWFELTYPDGHPYYPESIDLAFVITGEEEEEPMEDFGDAPDQPYPTFAANGGAQHPIVPGLLMGALIDGEFDGQPNATATGDDLAGVDDEDGVTFLGAMVPGGSATVQIDMTSALYGGMIDAWVDFAGDGSWAELGDQILVSKPVLPGVVSNLSFTVPASAVVGPTFARFRLSSSGGLTFFGPGPDGEVEDYAVNIEAEAWKWLQTPDLDDTGIDVNCTEPFILADDFLCQEPGRITDIFVWASWLGDYLPWDENPHAVDFTLSIHSDIPADPGSGEHSRPGDLLWFYEVPAGQFTADIWQDQIVEGWMDPPDFYVMPGDYTCWLYHFQIPPPEAFHQVGMPDSTVVYWLDVQARPHDLAATFGWKTSLDHWNDDAVWGTGAEPYFGPWSELLYPLTHEMEGDSIDLAFGLQMNYGTDVPDDPLPERHKLGQNVPNPFNPKTTINYEMPAGGGHVRIDIFDVTGRLVRTLVDGFRPEGGQTVTWDGVGADGEQMATGVYFYRMTAPGVESGRKMLLLK
jgi:hypothetical protein